MSQTHKTELEIFQELSYLCVSEGYIHTIAYLCFRDNIIQYQGELSPEDIAKYYTHERLIRTEISTLIGLMLKSEISMMTPKPSINQDYIKKTESLLQELHQSMILPFKKNFQEAILNKKKENLFKDGSTIRESIFYGAESAYDFQYLDLAVKKYQKDNEWFLKNKGFDINDAEKVVNSIVEIQYDNFYNLQGSLIGTDIEKWTMIELFCFNVQDLILKTGLEESVILNILYTFTYPSDHRNDFFVSVSDFNKINECPILRLNDSEYVLFQQYSLYEALYETPFYWFNEDTSYKNIAMKNRGDFTEEYSAERLKVVFGESRVFTNIDIYDKNKKNKLGEIDVLVVFADRAIVLQAKSKRLTIESRKGNDNTITKDFKYAILDSYEQGKDCALLLQDTDYRLFDINSNEVSVNRNYKEIYIFCVVSDHYPALSFQVDQFLEYENSLIIKPPFVMDIFLLDVMVEMLNTPLHFLSYANKRTQYFKTVISHNELTVLSYHLIKNLFIADDLSMIMLDDSISADLDQAIFVRRKGFSGKDTPDGILTKFKNTIIGNILDDIAYLEQPYTINFGFFLLQLSEDAIDGINKSIQKAIDLFIKDGQNHDITMGFDGMGFTIHCNILPYTDAYEELMNHCKDRKYMHKAKLWFGICINPFNKKVRFGIMSDKEWKQSNEMDIKIEKRKVAVRKKLPNRNDLCYCGSGKKYKKCCI